MKQKHRIQGSLVRILGNIALSLLGVAGALGMTEQLLRRFPNLIPPEIRVNPPVRRVQAFVDETYDLKQSDGDLYYLMRGSIMPLSQDQDQVVAHVHMITDAHGFRNSPPEKATYDIVALGDSFTRASGTAFPWPQKLAERTGSDVFNLGDVGFGPQEELKVLQQYGLEKHPELVILAYFEGNDLYDAASYEQANPFILFRFGRYVLNQSLEAWNEKESSETQARVISNYQYPIMVTIDKKNFEINFFSYYLSWLTVNHEAIESSQNYRLVREAILQIRDSSETAEAGFLLVYVPSKEHVYLPYLKDSETLSRIFTDVPTIKPDNAGFLQFSSERATPGLTRQHMDDQANLLAEFAAENHILFLDLTKKFQDEAGEGAELYYPFDTHWNQAGHDLAADTISEYLKEVLPDLSNKAPGN